MFDESDKKFVPIGSFSRTNHKSIEIEANVDLVTKLPHPW